MYFNTAVFTTLLLACGYTGVMLLIEAATCGNIGACLLASCALGATWLGLRLTWIMHQRAIDERR